MMKYNAEDMEKTSKRRKIIKSKISANYEELQHLPFKGYKRKFTVSVALPSSIVSNTQTAEMKSYLVGQIARSLTIFGVDEIIVYDDAAASSDVRQSMQFSSELFFFVMNLQYLETPQYLRKFLFRLHPDLKFAGLQNPVDAPHHLRKHEWLPYREGVVTSSSSNQKSSNKLNKTKEGSWVNCGLNRDVWIADVVEEGVRVTVKLEDDMKEIYNQRYTSGDQGGATLQGKAVSPEEPPNNLGLYWGYKVVAVPSFNEVFTNCSFSDNKKFDLVVGTSQNGDEITDAFELPSFKNMLLVFGGLPGLEAVIEGKSSSCPSKMVTKYFDLYINVCRHQRSRTIRTEEALPIALSILRPKLFLKKKKNKK